jgi:hypothetical protein
MPSNKEKYLEFTVFSEETEAKFETFLKKFHAFNMEIDTFLNRIKLWVDYHWSRYESKTITEEEGIHLADVMEATTVLIKMEEKLIILATELNKVQAEYSKQVIAMYSNASPAEVIKRLPKMHALCEEFLALGDLKVAEIEKEILDAKNQKKEVERAFNKNSN